MSKEKAIEALLENGEKRCKVVDVFGDHENECKAVYDGNGAVELYDFPIKHPPVARDHRFTTLDGLKDYLSSDHCKDDGVIFVSANHVDVDLQYKQHNENAQFVSLRLEPSEEFRALEFLMKGDVGQKDLWRALITTLHGCLDQSLLMTIQQIDFKAAEQDTVKIDVSGITSNAGGRHVEVTYPATGGEGSQTTTLEVDWKWTGRIWECFDREFEIDLRLELDTSDGLSFTFHPRRLESVMRTARLALVDHIADGLPKQFTVHEGEYLSGVVHPWLGSA